MLAAVTTAAFAQNAPVATISGRVTLDGGAPAVGYSVTARSTAYVSPAPAGEALTDAQGNYTIHIDTNLAPSLFTGTPSLPVDNQFTVTVTAPKEFFVAPSKQEVTLTPGQVTTHINFQVTSGPQISVHVENAQTDQPIPGVAVQYRTEFGPEQTVGITDAKGLLTFRVHDLMVYLSINPSPTLGLDPLPGNSFQTSITLNPLQNFIWNVQAYSASAISQSQITGTVLDASGQPAAHAIVSMFSQQTLQSTLETDDQGKFIVPVWNLNSDTMSGSIGFIRAVKGHQANGQTITFLDALRGMTIQLRKDYLASVSGVLVDSHGKPVSGRWISAGQLAGSGLTGARTDTEGRFVINRIWPENNSSLQITGDNFGSGFVNLLVNLKPGEEQNRGQIVVPDADSTLAGQVTTAQGQPIHEILEVTATGSHTNAIVQTDADGNFHFSQLVREPLTLKVFYPPAPGRTDYNLTNDSPDLAYQTQVTPANQTLHLAATNPVPPPAPPLPHALPPKPILSVPPTAPPQVVRGGGGFSDVNGMILQIGGFGEFNGFGPPADPRYACLWASFNIGWMYLPNGFLWTGTVDALNGLRYIVQDGSATLQDRQGRVIYSTTVPRPTGYQVDILSDPGKPSQITIHDPEGKLLTAFSVPEQTPYPIIQDKKLVITAADHHVYWQSQTEASMPKFYVMSTNNGRFFSYSSDGPLFLDADIQFSVASYRTVFEDGNGHIFFDGPLDVLTTTVKTPRDHLPLAFTPTYILIAAVINAPEVVKYQIYNLRGKVIDTGGWITHYR